MTTIETNSPGSPSTPEEVQAVAVPIAEGLAFGHTEADDKATNASETAWNNTTFGGTANDAMIEPATPPDVSIKVPKINATLAETALPSASPDTVATSVEPVAPTLAAAPVPAPAPEAPRPAADKGTLDAAGV